MKCHYCKNEAFWIARPSDNPVCWKHYRDNDGVTTKIEPLNTKKQKYEWHTYEVESGIRTNGIVDQEGVDILSINMYDSFFVFEDGITDPSKSRIASMIIDALEGGEAP